MTQYLELEDLLAAADAAVGQSAEVRDIGLLQAAVARPQATASGADAYPGLHEKAAALLHTLVTGHPLVVGNKRLVWVSVRLFYRMNDLDIHAQADEAIELVLAAADGRIRDVTVIAERLRSWAAGT